MKNLIITCILAAMVVSNGYGQNFDLLDAYKKKKLVVPDGRNVYAGDPAKHSLHANGLIWLKDTSFSEGTIEVDLRGLDEFQKSFIGIAFHGVDSIQYDLIYFRPFNFRAEDPVRKIHAVQYSSEPEYPWPVTREKMNGIYEKAVTPAPLGSDWFHAKIVVKGKQVQVFVDGSDTPSITVDKLNDRTNGLIGLWNVGKAGEFANLVISK